jgi:hypothetical protein
MQEKSLKTSRDLLMQEIRSNTTYFQPVIRNGWIIKFSVYKNTEILLMFVSKYTGQTIVRYFPEEDLAVRYINMIISKDPTVNYDATSL